MGWIASAGHGHLFTAGPVIVAQTTPTVPVDVVEEVDLEGITWDVALRAAVILVASILVALVVHRFLLTLVRRSGKEGIARFTARFAAATVVGIGVFYALAELGVRMGPLIGLLGIGGIALAFALQDLVGNVIGGVVLQTQRNFTIGDEVVTNGYEGVVEDVNFRTTWLRTFDGRMVVLPNSLVASNALEIQTAYEIRRTTLTVGVAYDTDLTEARDVLIETVRDVDGVMADPPAVAWVETFGESSIDFAVWFWHAPQIAVEWRVRNDVALAVKEALDAADITIPFPQRVLHRAPDAADPDE